MKNFLLFTILVISTNILFSQIWIKPNAVWHYNFSSINTGGFIRINYVGDSIIENKTVQKLVAKKYEFATDQNNGTQLIDSSSFGKFYTYVNGDTVFQWVDNQFEIYLNFSTSTNDSWIIGRNGGQDQFCSEISTTKVVGQNTIQINNVNYPTLSLQSADSCSVKINGDFNSHFGNHSQTLSTYQFLFPTQSICNSQIPDDTYLYSFRCYQDDELTYNPSGEECEYELIHLRLDNYENEDITIYPNPTTGTIYFNNQFQLQIVEVIDLMGNNVLSKELEVGQNELRLNLIAGVYQINLKNFNGKTCIKKLVVQ